MIPEGWTYKPLSDLASIKRGKFSVRPRNDPRYFGGKTPFVQTGDVVGAKGTLTSFSQTLNDAGVAVSKVFPAGTILMTIAANIGDTAISAFPVACPDSVVGIEPYRAHTDTLWLRAALEAKKKDLHAQAPQNAQKNINLEALRPLLLLTPPVREQGRIAEILSTWDRAMETVESLIANAREQETALAKVLLTGRTRLPGFSGNWNHEPISAIATRVTSRNEGADLPVLTISSTSGFVRQDEKYSREMAGKSVEDYIVLRQGEFAYNKGNSKTYQFGCLYELSGYEQALVPHVYVCFRLKKGYNRRFYGALFKADYLGPQLARLVNTGVRNNGLLNITSKEVLGTTVPVPSEEEQSAIADVLTAASSKVKALTVQRNTMREEKTALMQLLLTGKRRVNMTEGEAA